jgi:hypothetical protein
MDIREITNETSIVQGLISMLDAVDLNKIQQDLAKLSDESLDPNLYELSPKDAASYVALLSTASVFGYQYQANPVVKMLFKPETKDVFAFIYSRLQPLSGILSKIAAGEATTDEIEHETLRKGIRNRSLQRRQALASRL